MKIEIEINKELYDDLKVCLEETKLSMNEYLIVAIATSVNKDLRRIFLENEVEIDDVE